MRYTIIYTRFYWSESWGVRKHSPKEDEEKIISAKNKQEARNKMDEWFKKNLNPKSKYNDFVIFNIKESQ